MIFIWFRYLEDLAEVDPAKAYDHADTIHTAISNIMRESVEKLNGKYTEVSQPLDAISILTTATMIYEYVLQATDALKTGKTTKKRTISQTVDDEPPRPAKTMALEGGKLVATATASRPKANDEVQLHLKLNVIIITNDHSSLQILAIEEDDHLFLKIGKMAKALIADIYNEELKHDLLALLQEVDATSFPRVASCKLTTYHSIEIICIA